MSVLSSRRKMSKEPAELYLMPIMNLFVILIPFLLLTAAFVKSAIIRLYLPTMGAPAEEEPPPPTDRPRINLTLAVGEEGLQIGGAEAILPVIKKIKDEKTGEMVNDFKKLEEILIKIKDQYPETENIILIPQADTKYDLIVKLMDVTRETVVKDKNGEPVQKTLFPIVSIGEVQPGAPAGGP